MADHPSPPKQRDFVDVRTNGNGNGSWHLQPHISFRVSLGAVLALAAQTVFFIGWLVTLHNDVGVNRQRLDAHQRQIDGIDSGGSRAAILLSQRVGILEGSQSQQDRTTQNIEQRLNDLNLLIARDITANQAKVQGQLDTLGALFRRLDEQQTRLIQALDNTYSMLNQHMRESGDTKTRPNP